MRRINLIFLVLAFFPGLSCEDALINRLPSDVSFNISYRMLEGRKINCIEADQKGNIAIGSDNELFFLSDGERYSYNLDFEVLDLSIAPDKSLWIGTKGGGLGHLYRKSFTWYTMNNAGLPRDYVRHVVAAPDGKVWFTSCAHLIGGLGMFDGKKFEFYTPENSPLNQNIIEDIEINDDGVVYIATTGTVGRTNIYRIYRQTWDCLGNEEGMFYWIFSFTLGPSGVLYLIEDFSLSSAFNTNNLFQYRDDQWSKIETQDMPKLPYFTRIKADRRDYCWIAGSDTESACLHVFNGKSWINSPKDLFPGDYITAIEVDNNNNIWVGTWNNGVYIFNQ